MVKTWNEWQSDKDFTVCCYQPEIQKTSVRCRSCDAVYDLLGNLTAENYRQEGWSGLNKDANTYANRHKKECKPRKQPEAKKQLE